MAWSQDDWLAKRSTRWEGAERPGDALPPQTAPPSVTTLNQRQNWHGPTIPSFNDLGPLPSSIYSRNFPRTNAWKMQIPEAPICHDSCPLGEQPSSMVDAVQPSSASPATPSSGIVICLFCLKTELTIHVAIASDAQVVVTLAAYMDVVTPAAFHIAHTSDHRFSLRRRW